MLDRVGLGLTLGAAAGLFIDYLVANTKGPGFLLRVGGKPGINKLRVDRSLEPLWDFGGSGRGSRV